jgi:hypothetical protein
LVEQVDQPTGFRHLSAQGLGPLAKGTVGRHERRPTGGILDDGDQCFVTTAGRVNDRDAVGGSGFRTPAAGAFENNDHRFVEPS